MNLFSPKVNLMSFNIIVTLESPVNWKLLNCIVCFTLFCKWKFKTFYDFVRISLPLSWTAHQNVLIIKWLESFTPCRVKCSNYHGLPITPGCMNTMTFPVHATVWREALWSEMFSNWYQLHYPVSRVSSIFLLTGDNTGLHYTWVASHMGGRVEIKFSTPLHHTLQYWHQTFQSFKAHTFLLHLETILKKYYQHFTTFRHPGWACRHQTCEHVTLAKG